jgi:hypothetical protein
MQELEDQADEEEEEEQQEGSPSKRLRHSPEGFQQLTAKQKLRELRRARREMDEYRALGSSYGFPSVLLLLRIAEQCGMNITNALLW